MLKPSEPPPLESAVGVPARFRKNPTSLLSGSPEARLKVKTPANEPAASIVPKLAMGTQFSTVPPGKRLVSKVISY